MATPLDAERAKLRAEGWNEAQIDDILMRRAVAGTSQQAAGGAPVQVPMSGVLGNASAVLSHAKGAIPVLKADLANLSNSGATRKSRGMSGLKLLGAAVVIAALGYAIYQEWQQHILSATARANAEAISAAIKTYQDCYMNALGAADEDNAVDACDKYAPDQKEQALIRQQRIENRKQHAEAKWWQSPQQAQPTFDERDKACKKSDPKTGYNANYGRCMPSI